MWLHVCVYASVNIKISHIFIFELLEILPLKIFIAFFIVYITADIFMISFFSMNFLPNKLFASSVKCYIFPLKSNSQLRSCLNSEGTSGSFVVQSASFSQITACLCEVSLNSTSLVPNRWVTRGDFCSKEVIWFCVSCHQEMLETGSQRTKCYLPACVSHIALFILLTT